MEIIDNVYFYSLCDGEIKEYEGHINISYKWLFKEKNNKEVPHFGKVAKKEGKIFMDSIWFTEHKTIDEVVLFFIREYENRIDNYNKAIESVNKKMNLLKNVTKQEVCND